MNGYTINYSNTTTNGFINIPVGTYDPSTSLKLIGPNYKGYGEAIAENFLHLLENFSNTVPPANPIEGQLWYDTSNSSAKVLKILDRSNWQPINGIYQQPDIPTRAKLGDLWINTDTIQIKICSGPGPTWITIGTDFTQGNQTGYDNLAILGTDGLEHSVILSYLNGEVITILSKEIFKPQAIIDGFDNLIPGLNFSTKTFDSSIPKVFGIATEASSLRVTSPVSQAISANFFLRKDIPQTLSESLEISNNTGIRIGATTSTFFLQRLGNDGIISSIRRGSNINLSITDLSGVSRTLLAINGGAQAVGIGPGNVNPQYTLDVAGTFKVSGLTTLTNNLFVGTDLFVGSTATISGSMSIAGTSTFGNTIYSRNIEPLNDSSDIGIQSQPFDTAYIRTINTVNTINGTALSANRLTTPTVFSGNGQVKLVSTSTFNGSRDMFFTATVTHKSIDEQQTTSTVSKSYSLAVSNNTDSLFRVTKNDFLADISPGLSSSGMIMTWAGDLVPTGWAFCDGATYNQSGIYNSLYSVIGIKYGSTAPGTFQVPNLPSLTATGPVPLKYIIRI